MSADLPAAANPANASEAPAEQGFKVIRVFPTLYLIVRIEILIKRAFRLQIFAGNLAYSTDDAALKAFFAPIASEMYVHLKVVFAVSHVLTMRALFQSRLIPFQPLRPGHLSRSTFRRLWFRHCLHPSCRRESRRRSKQAGT